MWLGGAAPSSGVSVIPGDRQEQKRLLALDPMMEQESEEIRQKYQSKRQPILDALEAKKRRQQNF